MIQRIVLLKLHQQFATKSERAAVAEHSQRVLARLPGVRELKVGVAADATTADGWDLSLVLNFASVDELEPYRVHPDHRAYVDEYLKPRLAGIAAWNFEIVS